MSCANSGGVNESMLLIGFEDVKMPPKNLDDKPKYSAREQVDFMKEFRRSVELKLARSHQQIHALAESIAAWVENNPLGADLRWSEGKMGYQLVQREYVNPPPLDDWGLALGECVHNIRSALDNLAYALARLASDPPLNPGRISFPIFQDAQQFKTSGVRSINQLPKKAAQLIEMLQPFQRDGSAQFGRPEQDPLVHLQELNNFDKHRIPSVIVFVPQEVKVKFSVQFEVEADALKNVPPDVTCWTGPLAAGVILLEQRTNAPIISVDWEFETKANIGISASDGTAPAIEILVWLHNHAGLVASQFDELFV
ncbi:hypothetical protein [Pseudomonas proteolytica]|uniref:hypothetical protein n=1 Tax=Pseudomonas proteolytica TaxID=219574 RepID=UPI0014738332|nr:hypothetical protein [Pseudomonas proteolytica]NMY95644.1 hypothetical protein [Pseudomonas proteolytica]